MQRGLQRIRLPPGPRDRNCSKQYAGSLEWNTSPYSVLHTSTVSSHDLLLYAFTVIALPDYSFSLYHRDAKGYDAFVKLDKKILKQDVNKKEIPINLNFRAKFFPEAVNDELIGEVVQRYRGPCSGSFALLSMWQLRIKFCTILTTKCAFVRQIVLETNQGRDCGWEYILPRRTVCTVCSTINASAAC